MDIKRVLASAPRDHDPGSARPLLTTWGEALDPENVRGEHPHPQFARDRFISLNGWWDYAFMPTGSHRTVRPPDAFDGRILVPFSPESLLSGVGRQLQPDELLWYVRRVPVPDLRPDERCILHFEAVDFACACCVNGQVVGTHEGGYLPFSFDITEALRAEGPIAAQDAEADSEDGGLPAGEDEEDGAKGDAEGSFEEAAELALPREFVLALCVHDPSDAGTQPRGKQKLKRGGIWYTAQSGVWQPVWMEVVPARRVLALTLHPDSEAAALTADVDVSGDAGLVRIYVSDPAGRQVAVGEAFAEEGSVPYGAAVGRRDGADGQGDADGQDGATVTGGTGNQPVRRVRLRLDLGSVHCWSPDDPCLYDIVVRYGADAVRSYTAFRTVEVRPEGAGRYRFLLNGEPLLLRGVLDQGYWSDGLMTAPSDEALVFDIRAMKDAGFNMLRKHLKVEADRWYYHCDRLGMLVWQDMVSGGGAYDSWETSYRPTLWRGSWNRYDDTSASHQRKLGSDDAAYQRQWLRDCRGTVAHLRNHPSVVAWVLFNEGWGQFDALACAEEIRLLDPTRPIDATSGWYDQGAGDFQSVHNYFRPLEVYRDRRDLAGYARLAGGRAFAISEFGGVVHAVEGHSAFAGTYGYGAKDTPAEWREEVRRTLGEAAALEGAGLSVYVYTQLSDVEEECNGILTYDRRVNKLKEDSHGRGSAGM